MPVLIFELFWVLWYLPFSYHVKGVILLSTFYVLIGFSRARFHEVLSKKLVMRYGLVYGIIFLVALGTARWL